MSEYNAKGISDEFIFIMQKGRMYKLIPDIVFQCPCVQFVMSNHLCTHLCFFHSVIIFTALPL